MSAVLNSYGYSDICSEDENDNLNSWNKVYTAYNNEKDRECFLKVINKEILKQCDYDLLTQQIEREEKLIELCKSDNIIKLYRKIETEEYIIFEFEKCDKNLTDFMSNNGDIEGDKEGGEKKSEKLFFKKFAVELAKGLKVIHEKGVMHRDIKPSNILMNNYEDYFSDLENLEIKIGDFGCSTFIKDNNSEGIGSVLYSAPEINQGLEYDEKCDIWSFGVTLYELYFGYLPYGPDPTLNSILCIIDDPENFILRRSGIPNLDVFFKRVLTLDPKERMGFDELFEYIFNKDFMDKNVICINNNQKYQQIYDKIKKEKKVDYGKGYTQESGSDQKTEEKNTKTLLKITSGGQFPDIMNYANGSTTGEERYNNIIYYDENVNFIKSINKDSDIFERYTSGAFILCTNIESLKLIREEILIQIKKDKRTAFNFITTGSTCEKIIQFIKENQEFANCIKHVCVFCMNLKRWGPLKEKYPDIVYNVYNTRKEVLNFIDIFSTKEIRPYPLTKLVTCEEYYSKYKDRHKKISLFYGDLTLETYKKNLKEMKQLINEEEKTNELKNKNTNNLIEGLLKFDINQDLQVLDKLIIKEYTKNSYYGDLNKWLMNSKLNSYDTIAYYTARLMYSLNSYGNNKKMYFNETKDLRRGIKIPYSCLLPYERAKGKVILLSGFTSTSESEKAARTFSGRDKAKEQYKTRKLFSIIYTIKNAYKKSWIANCVNVQQESVYKKEQEILYQPFSFYFVRDVQIDLPNFSADIILETIGKEEILEEKLKIGKEIEYNEKKRIMQVKKEDK